MELYQELHNAYGKYFTAKNYKRAVECLERLYELDKAKTLPVIIDYRNKVTALTRSGVDIAANMDNLRKSYFVTAKERFDDYCIALEWEREPKRRFYLPRRKQLLPVVNSLQDLADDKLDLLAVSEPPGVGKTTLAIFFLTWFGGKYPDKPNLGASHSNAFLRGVYDEILRILTRADEYHWREILTDVPLAGTNAKDMRIDLGKPKRFETFEFSSIGSGNAGKVRAMSLLYCDDLVDGIETAMSNERLQKIWQQYTTDLRQRKIGQCKELHIATRWSVHDPIGKLQSLYEGNERARFLAFAAVDENDHSNFNYPYGIGFTDEFYHEQREAMDDASWRALYMNVPIEREGLLYNAEELRRYFELPEGEPDAILAVCDTKDRGTDYCVLPIAYQYGSDYYIEEILCDNSNPEIVEARLVAKLVEHKVKMARFESNSAGGKIAEKVQKEVRKQKGVTKITTKYSTANKETRIIVDSPFVKERFLFKDESTYKGNKDYRRAIGFLCSYTMAGNNKNDDVPDAMSMLANFIQSLSSLTAVVVKRPF